MDTFALSQQLNREIAEKRIARDRLLENATSLTAELHELDEQEKLLNALVARYARKPNESEHTPNIDDVQHNSASGPQKSIRVDWPVGPHYQKKVQGKNIQAWARYKLVSADWYLLTLRQIVEQTPKLERYLGVEMTIDAIVQALGATFDAAVYGLTRAIEKALKVPVDRRTPIHLACWSALTLETKLLGVDVPSAPGITAALLGEHSECPEGWLAQLLMLRNYSSRRDLLIRHWSIDGADPGMRIDVPGIGPQPLTEYLEKARDATAGLLETMLHDVDDARHGRLYVADVDDPKKATVLRQLPDLLQRAQVLP